MSRLPIHSVGCHSALVSTPVEHCYAQIALPERKLSLQRGQNLPLVLSVNQLLKSTTAAYSQKYRNFFNKYTKRFMQQLVIVS